MNESLFTVKCTHKQMTHTRHKNIITEYQAIYTKSGVTGPDFQRFKFHSPGVHVPKGGYQVLSSVQVTTAFPTRLCSLQ